MRAARIFLVLVFVLGVSTAVHAEWHAGIGTGLFRQNAEGTEGFHTNLLGPIAYEVDLSPEDFQDLTESAFGFGGYATNGTWVLRYSLGIFKLEGQASKTVTSPVAGTASVKLDYDVTFGEFIAGYPVYSKGNFTLMAEAGLRHTGHDITIATNITTTGTTSTSGNVDESWTDFVGGVSAALKFSDKWSWNSLLNAGIGGSEGTITAQTGIGWQFAKRWSADLYAKYAALEYENGKPGDSDWYLYDVDEFGVGLGFLFHF